MVREIAETELKELLELYLYLHEDAVPEMTEHLKHTWNTILQDENHHMIVNEIDGKIVSSCVCVVIPNLTKKQGRPQRSALLFGFKLTPLLARLLLPVSRGRRRWSQRR